MNFYVSYLPHALVSIVVQHIHLMPTQERTNLSTINKAAVVLGKSHQAILSTESKKTTPARADIMTGVILVTALTLPPPPAPSDKFLTD